MSCALYSDISLALGQLTNDQDATGTTMGRSHRKR